VIAAGVLGVPTVDCDVRTIIGTVVPGVPKDPVEDKGVCIVAITATGELCVAAVDGDVSTVVVVRFGVTRVPVVDTGDARVLGICVTVAKTTNYKPKIKTVILTSNPH